MNTNPESRTETIRQLAITQHHEEGVVEIDDELTAKDISEIESNGCYVRAWVWVSFADTVLDKETAE